MRLTRHLDLKNFGDPTALAGLECDDARLPSGKFENLQTTPFRNDAMTAV